MSSSTEDLILLFKAEKSLVKYLRSMNNSSKTKEIKKAINLYLETVDFDEETETESYVFHPVNAFHLLKRATKWFSKLNNLSPNVNFEFHLPSSGEAINEASNGLADLQEHYGLDSMELVKVYILCYH